MLLAFGMVCALLESQRTGRGQVVDAAMVDGSLAQMALLFGMMSAGQFVGNPGDHVLSGAAPFYDTYKTADGKFIAIGSLEPQFFKLLLDKLEIPYREFADAGFRSVSEDMDYSKWPALRKRLTDSFAGKSRDEWCAILEGTDVCFAPVLTLAEVQEHAHNRARKAVISIEGVLQNAPAPRYSHSTCARPSPPPYCGQHSESVLTDCGYSAQEIQDLYKEGAIIKS
jgi:alpha-methylacyl-CoA racemase